MTTGENLKKKAGIIDKAENKLLDGIKTSEKAVFNKVLSILRKLAQKEGNLTKETINNKFLSSLTAKVLKVIRKSTLQKKIIEFLPNFETIEALNSDLYKGITGSAFDKVIKAEISAYRRITIDNIIDNLIGEKQLKGSYINPIRDIIFKGVALKSPVKNVEKELETYIVGNKTKAGQFTRYIKQIAIDAINSHDGLINDIARDAYQLDGFRYVGSLIKTSRGNCEHLVNSTGKLKQFEVKRGLYRVEDIPKIIRVLDKGKGSGWNENTTAATFAQYRGGYNCRHQVVYLPLPPD